MIFTTSDLEPPETATSLRIERFEGKVDLAAGLGMLRSERGVRSLLCEGGPRLHGNLVEAGLVDELFVTVAPKLAGGMGPNLIEGAAEQPRELELGVAARRRRRAVLPLPGQHLGGGMRPRSSTRRSPRRSIRSAMIVLARIAASPELTWIERMPSRDQ